MINRYFQKKYIYRSYSSNHINSVLNVHLSRGVYIISEGDNQLFALYKPKDVLSHPNNNNKSKDKSKKRENCLLTSNYDHTTESYLLISHLDEKSMRHKESVNNQNDNKYLYLCNRLDSATSGIILATTNKETSIAVKKEFLLRTVQKQYCALVYSCDLFKLIDHNKNQNIKKNNNIKLRWEDSYFVNKNMDKDYIRGLNLTNLSSKSEAVNAITEIIVDPKYFSESITKMTTIIKLIPKTGYTHQLRYQCKIHGCPIVGDKVYGNFHQNKKFISQIKDINLLKKKSGFDLIPSNNLNRLFLHSEKINLKYKLNDHTFYFFAESQIPHEFLI